MQYAVLLTGLATAASAFNLPQFKALEQRQAPSVAPSATVFTTVTTCPFASTFTTASRTVVKSGVVTSTIVTTVCSSKRPSASAKVPVVANATAFYPTGTGAAQPTLTVTFQQRIDNYKLQKVNINLKQQQQLFQQLVRNLPSQLSQQQATFITSESKQLFGPTGAVFTAGSQTLVNNAQPTSPPTIAAFRGAASKTVISTGSALIIAAVMVLAL